MPQHSKLLASKYVKGVFWKATIQIYVLEYFFACVLWLMSTVEEKCHDNYPKTLIRNRKLHQVISDTDSTGGKKLSFKIK